MKDNGEKEKLKEEVDSYCLMGRVMKENGNKIKHMVMEYIGTVMGHTMKDIG